MTVNSESSCIRMMSRNNGLSSYRATLSENCERYRSALFEQDGFVLVGGGKQMKRWMSLFMVLVLCLSLCACGSAATPTEPPTEPPTEAPTEAPTEPPEPTISPEESARLAAYHEKMAAVLTDVNRYDFPFQKNIKAVETVKHQIIGSHKYGESVYVDTHIAPEWVAEEPEDVRFLVECAYGASEKGMYMIGGGKAYQYYVTVRVIDMATGNICAKTSFDGGEPPETVSEPGDHYGSKVDEAEIREWITSVIEAEAPKFAEDALKEVKDLMEILGTPSRNYLLQFMQEYGGASGEFSDGMIEYALDLCGIDWKEHALLEAQEALAVQPHDLFGYYSYGYIIKHLTKNRDFTQEEAAYAADNCGADWKEQCCLQVKQYLEDDLTYNDTRKWLTEELKNRHLFTDEEIEYALVQCGVK